MGRTSKTEAVVLRSFRLGEADRVLHLYTAERGRVGAVAKGIRKTKSRFGARLEPLSHVELLLHQSPEQEATERAFTALTRFLDALDELPSRVPAAPRLDPLALSFQLKLLWLSGYLPHLESCVECGSEYEQLVGYLPAAGGAVCRACGPGAISLSPAGLHGIRVLVHTPLAAARAAGLTAPGARETLAV